MNLPLNHPRNTKKPPQPSRQGKIRDIYELDESLIIQASDRLSAFDYVFSEKISGKGSILTQISNHWFSLIKHVGNHLIETDYKKFPEPFSKYSMFSDNSIWVKKAKRFNFECIARGYLLGSGYQEYQKSGSICDLHLPNNIQLGEKLSEAIFTPTTKSNTGHDEAISFDVMKKSLGSDIASQLRRLTLDIYTWANKQLEASKIILLDTKFEFGIYEGELILIDEVLTPDSSRFCEKEKYEASLSQGMPPPSMDKQIIRNYLEKIGWNKKPPLPSLPEEILKETKMNYQKIQKKIVALLH